MPKYLYVPQGVTISSLSEQEQGAESTAHAHNRNEGITFEAPSAYRKGHMAGWLSAHMWMLDHLVAMSAEQPQAILDVAQPQRIPMALPDAVDAGVRLAVRMALTYPQDYNEQQLVFIHEAENWLSMHRP